MTAKEKRILEGFIAKDKACRDEFVREYSNLIYSAIYRTFARQGWNADPNTIKDYYQEMFILLLENDCAKLRSFKGNSKFSYWLWVVTARSVINFMIKDSRKTRKTVSLQTKIGENEESELSDIFKDDKQVDEKHIIEETMDNKDKIEFFYKYLGKFDPEEQYILKAFCIQKIPLKQIAKVVGKSEDAVSMQKSRLVEEIKVMYKKDVGS